LQQGRYLVLRTQGQEFSWRMRTGANDDNSDCGGGTVSRSSSSYSGLSLVLRMGCAHTAERAGGWSARRAAAEQTSFLSSSHLQSGVLFLSFRVFLRYHFDEVQAARATFHFGSRRRASAETVIFHGTSHSSCKKWRSRTGNR
jgi:hypothetical protein